VLQEDFRLLRAECVLDIKEITEGSVMLFRRSNILLFKQSGFTLEFEVT
jgi:hypothetical protein